MPSASLIIMDQMAPSPTPANFGVYMNDGVRKVDYVLVYKEDSQQKDSAEFEERRKFFEENLESVGLNLETERFEQKGELLAFVKVHAPWKVLCQLAEHLRMKMPLKIFDKPVVKQNTLLKNSNNKDLTNGIVDLTFRPTETMQALDGLVIHWPFKRKRQDMFAIRDESTFFSEKQRIEIVYELLQKAGNNPNKIKERGLEALLEEKVYVAGYPLHDGELKQSSYGSDPSETIPVRQKLKDTWAHWKTAFRRQPLNDIRNYFGEKIGFYYAFMDEYTRLLTFPSLIGLITFLYGVINTAYNPEMDEICTEELSGGIPHKGVGFEEYVSEEHVNTTVVRPFFVGDYKMCPVCRPPDCEHWDMWHEGCFQYGWAFRLDNQCSIFLSAFTTLWAILFLKYWKRREATLAAEWGTEDSEEQDLIIRPEYEKRAPTQRKNPVTLEQEPYVPMRTKCKWMSVSILATVAFLIFACVCLICLVISRIKLYAVMRHLPPPFKEKSIDIARWIIHGFIFIVVLILENVYSRFAFRLTAYECPRTEKQFLNSLLWKVFIFQLLNDLIPIGYAAWMKGKTVQTPKDMQFVDELCDGGCMGEVTELVAILLLLRLIIGNATELGIPLMKNAMKRFKMRKEVVDNTAIPQYVKDYQLEPVEFDGVFEDYMEMMIQFAFIVLFIPALPVAPFVCLLNNIAEIRVDGTKMLQTSRRAVPFRVSGIGIWNRFLNIINKLGIICNAGLLAFTSDNIPRLYYLWVYKKDANITDSGYHGYTKFSLSSINVTEYGHEDAHEMIENNITHCWYPDFREAEEPYRLKPIYWEITFYRMVVFAVYCVVFFTLTWVVNTFINDMPDSVRTKILRRQHIVTKAMEVDAAIKQSKWTNNNPESLDNAPDNKDVKKNGKIIVEESAEDNVVPKEKSFNQTFQAPRPPMFNIRPQETVTIKDVENVASSNNNTDNEKSEQKTMPNFSSMNSTDNANGKINDKGFSNGISMTTLSSVPTIDNTGNSIINVNRRPSQPNPGNFLFKLRQDSQSDKSQTVKIRRPSSGVTSNGTEQSTLTKY